MTWANNRYVGDWISDVCSTDLVELAGKMLLVRAPTKWASTETSPLRKWLPLRLTVALRSEERRVGKECRAGEWASPQTLTLTVRFKPLMVFGLAMARVAPLRM